MTNQEIFDIAVKGLASQGYKRSIDNTGRCLYNGPNGTHCAVGWLIKDVELPSDAVTWGIRTLFNEHPYIFRSLDMTYEKLLFIDALQQAHDEGDSPERMQGNLSRLADRFGLFYSLNTTEGE